MRKWLGASMLLIFIGGAATLAVNVWREENDTIPETTDTISVVAATASVERFCSTCHTQPPPDAEPKSLWPEKTRNDVRLCAKRATLARYADSPDGRRG